VSAGRGSAADLSRRARSLEVSPTVAVAQEAAALRAGGVRVLDFSVGEPDQPTPAHVCAAATAALAAGRTRYTAAAGLPELRAAVAKRYQQDFHMGFSVDEVVITTGGKQALYLACQALLDRGAEVIIPTPHWPTFSEAVRLAGGRPVLARTREDEGFRITAAMVAKLTSAHTKALIVNSPSNPTGVVVEQSELMALAELAERRRFSLLFDDTYARLSFGKTPVDLGVVRSAIGERLVVLGTASKTYCMTGWRIGWVLGPKPLVDACTALISHSTQCPATFAQVGAVQALTGSQKTVRELAAEYKRRRDFLYPLLAGAEGVTCVAPGGAFYLFPNVSSCLGPQVPSTLELARRLLRERSVAVVPGEGFGAPGYFRISFARPMEELREGAERIVGFLTALREPRRALGSSRKAG
jgi:aspartate aminotransferase